MRRLLLKLAVGLHVLLGASAFAVEDEITVLGVYSSNATTTFINSQLANLVTAWNGTGAIGFPNAVSVTIANGGIAVPLGIPLSGSDSAQLTAAKNHLESSNLRNQWGADIVIVFTGNFAQGCGLAPQTIWTTLGNTPSTFMPDLNFVDRRPAELEYLAVINTSATCGLSSWGRHFTAHEFGHLLGGGHERFISPAGPTDGVYYNDVSHADVKILPSGRGGPDVGRMTALSTSLGEYIECSGISCTHILRFSTANYGAPGGPTNDNSDAFDDLARSVANFRQPVQCSLTKPQQVTGWVTNACNEFGYTEHFITWIDACPEQADSYDVHTSTVSFLGPFVYGWTEPAPFAFAMSIGGSTWAKAAACSGSSCTSISNSWYHAPYLCD